jgi:hypothetical protein
MQTQRVPHFRPAALALGLFLVTACTDSKPGQSDAVVPRWIGRTDLTIGSLDGPHDQFADVAGLAVGPDGRIFVADADHNTVLAFDSTGRFLFTIGRQGSGPGELSGPCCPTLDESGRLWVRDAFNARYNIYTIGATGATLAQTRKTSPGAGGLRSRITFDSAGRLVDVSARLVDGRMQLFRFHVDSGGTTQAVDTIPMPPDDSTGVHRFAAGDAIGFVSQPFGPRFLVDQAPGGGYARAVSSRYLVTWISPGTATNRTIRRDMIGPALSARERREADSALQAAIARAGGAGGTVPFGVPGSKTPIRAVFFDRQGRLWVQLHVADGENNRADVWEAGGRRVGNAEWPGDVDFQMGVIDDRVGYGVKVDSAGVPQVVRVRFADGGGAGR